MLTVTRHDDGTFTLADADETERFSVELITQASDGLTYDRETNIITLTAANGVWRYKIDRFDDDWNYADRVVIAHLIEQP